MTTAPNTGWNGPSVMSSPRYLAENERPGRRRRVSDGDRALGQRERRVEARAVAIMQFEYGLAGCDWLARSGQHDDANGRVDTVIHPVASGSQRHRRTADERCVKAREDACARSGNDMPRWCGRQAPVVVDNPGIAALVLDDLPEPIQAGARGNRVTYATVGVGPVRGDPADHEHPRSQLDGHFDEICRTASLQHLETLDHLE